MKKNDTETIVQFVGEIDDKRYVVRHADGHLEIKEDQTDWARVDALTDEDIERSIEGDPDWEPFRDIDWSKAEFIVPTEPKTPISIRLDADVLAFFREQGPGYQKRINAVLREFMRSAQSHGKARRARAGKAPRTKPTEAAE